MNIWPILAGIAFFALLGAGLYFAPRSGGGPESPDVTDVTPAPMPETTFAITSSAFAPGGLIPPAYTCDGDKTKNPPLAFSGVPEATQSLVLIMDDPDVPKALRPDGVFDHWAVFNMPPDTREIAEGGPVPGIQGVNGGGKNAYTGPCPPPEYEPSEHRYIFRLYALDSELALEEGATKQEVLDALMPHLLVQTELIGRYSRK